MFCPPVHAGSHSAVQNSTEASFERERMLNMLLITGVMDKLVSDCQRHFTNAEEPASLPLIAG